MTSAFRSLSTFNYRMWASGAIVSNIGTWMQRIAQDWLVLTQLTDNNATAVGVVMALQFGPQLLLFPVTGFAADHLDRRKLLIATQSSLAILALGLGILTITGMVQLWHVYVFAFLHGCTTAFDSPTRQSFISDMVEEGNIINAVALNSTSFQIARMIGPAIAGMLISKVGTGPAFLINSLSFIAVIGALLSLRVAELHKREKAEITGRGVADGFRYVRERPNIITVFIMLFLIGTFGLNFPIYISTMAVTVFHLGPGLFGLLMSTMAVGSIIGALLSARRTSPHVNILLIGAFLFGLGLTLAALMPNYWLFGLALVVTGASTQTFTTTANSLVQLSTDSVMRGRVMAIYVALFMGGTPIGAPFVGWVADRFGARWGLSVGALAGFLAAIVGICYLAKFRHLRLDNAGKGTRLIMDEGDMYGFSVVAES